MMVAPDGTPVSPRPRPSRPGRPVSALAGRRNDALLALVRLFGYSSFDLAEMFGLPLRTVQAALKQARARHEAAGGADPTPAIDGPDVTAEDLLETPLTDDPAGPRYKDDPVAAGWIDQNKHRFHAAHEDCPPSPLSRSLRRRAR